MRCIAFGFLKKIPNILYESMSEHVEHHHYILPDVLQVGLTTVFCGKAPSMESRRQQAYYAHPTNMFWKILAQTGMTDRLLKPEEFRTLPKYGIGLTDLNKTEFGSDHQLIGSGDDPGSVHDKILNCQPRYLAFTGKNNGMMFLHGVFGRKKSEPVVCGVQDGYKIGMTEIVILPSTSARARRFWDASYWKILADLHKESKCSLVSTP